MNRFLILTVLLACATASAQDAAIVDSQDGSITFDRSATSLVGGRTAGQPPIIVVNAKRLTGTGWSTPTAGTLNVAGAVTGAVQATQLNPVGENVQLFAQTSTAAPTIMRDGAITQWVGRSRACPEYYTGNITWEAEQIKTVTNNAWTDTGATTNYSEAGCVAVVETRWTSQSSGCPAGYTGTITWEAEERRVAGGPWSATGGTRNRSEGCTPVVDPGAGGGNDPPTVYATCTFTATSGTSTTRGMTRGDGQCGQGGAFVGNSSTTVYATFSVGDAYLGTENTGSYRVQMNDPSQYSIVWGGSCSGTGVTCQTGSQQANWTGNGAFWSATVTVTRISNGKSTYVPVTAYYAPCGVQNSLECP